MADAVDSLIAQHQQLDAVDSLIAQHEALSTAPQAAPQQPQSITSPLQQAGAKIAQDWRGMQQGGAGLQMLKGANMPFNAIGNIAGGVLGTVGNIYDKLNPAQIFGQQQPIGQTLQNTGSSIAQIFKSPALEQAGGAIANTGAGKAVYQAAQNPYFQESAKLGINIASLFPGEKALQAGINTLVPAARTGVEQSIVNVAKGMQDAAANMTAKRLALKANDIKGIGGSLEDATDAIKKYGLVGNSAATFHESAHNQIADAATKLKDIFAVRSDIASDPESKVDLQSAILNAREKAMTNTRINKTSINSAFDNLTDNLVQHYGEKLDNINLPEAQQLKREVGADADWNDWHPQGNSDRSKTLNYFYDELKTQLENKGGPEVKELNSKMSDLITLDRAAQKRMVVEARKDPISLKNALGITAAIASGHIAPLAVGGLDIASKSPLVAKALYGTGNALESAATQSIGNLFKRK